MFDLYLLTQIFLLVICANAAAPPFAKHEIKRGDCEDKVNAISSNIAVKAAEDAKAAEHAQAEAGAAAAHEVKEKLAEQAVEAAKAAQAALAGKVALVEELTREDEALKLVNSELLLSKAELEKAINAEMKSLSEEKGLEKVLNTALHVAESAATDADHAMKGVENDLIKKEKVLESALQHTEILEKEEKKAKSDLDSTKEATKNAIQAATDAKSNALRNKRRIARINY
ncbi:hypothetical protein WA026_009704 [Henosepilachna vigintioctopunctata]|uniref:Uncharacterized protein n=1 Tax=Henosepilachna vigintioctopunctata TaxID=420089 RepID=A0AAW1U059_9CUCU